MAATMPATHFKHPPDAFLVSTMISREMPPILLKQARKLQATLARNYRSLTGLLTDGGEV